MSNQVSDHPLTGIKHLAAFAVAGIWGLGVGMIDLHENIGITLSVIGIVATVWLYWGDILQMRANNMRQWPRIGLVLICLEILVPGVLIFARAEEIKPTIAGRSSTNQSGGQNGGNITNNGPVYNGAAPSKFVVPPECPPDTKLVIKNGSAFNNGADGYKIGKDSHVCIIDSTANGNKGQGFNAQ